MSLSFDNAGSGDADDECQVQNDGGMHCVDESGSAVTMSNSSLTRLAETVAGQDLSRTLLLKLRSGLSRVRYGI